MQSAEADIYYKIRGRGFPLIFLHGNGEDHTIFEPHVKYFSRYYLTVQIDSRGHGRSSHGKGTLTIEQMAEDVFAVMDALSIRRAAVIGFSDGANIGMQMAVLDQERLAALIAVGGNAFPGDCARASLCRCGCSISFTAQPLPYLLITRRRRSCTG